MPTVADSGLGLLWPVIAGAELGGEVGRPQSGTEAVVDEGRETTAGVKLPALLLLTCS